MKEPVKLFLDPLSHHFEGDRLFDSENAWFGGDNILGPYAHLRAWLAARGIEVHTADLLESGAVAPADVNLYVTMGIRDRYPRLLRRDDVILSAFFANECPVAEPQLYLDLDDAARAFRRLYSFSTTEALRPFLRRPLEFESFRFPQAFEAVHEAAWARADRKFLTIINANKVPRITRDELYTERLRAIAYFEARGEIDLYGVGWDGPPFRIGTTRVPAQLRRGAYLAERYWRRVVPDRDPLRVAARRAWRGAVRSKIDTLADYRFAVCFENMELDGWVTEKIFDCFFAGTIPIYLGAPDIEDWVPGECFVDMRRFRGYEELREHLRSLDASAVEGYREAARAYLGSEQFRPFTKQAFAELIGSIVAEDAGIGLETGVAVG